VSYNGSGVFQINSSGQPVITGTVISSTAFNALTADLATGLSTAITKDGQTTTTARVPFAQGINSTLTTDATSATTGSIITAGGISMQKALWVGTTSRHVGATQFDAAITYGGVTLSNAVTGTGNMVLSASPTFTGTIIAAGATFSSPVTINDSTEVQLTMGGSNGSQGRLRTQWDGSGAAGRVTLSAKNIAGTLTDVFRINGEGVLSTCLGPLGIGMTPTVPLSVLGPVYATSAIAAFRGPNSGPCGIDFTVAAGMVASIKFDNTTTLTGNANSIQIVTGAGSISFAPSGTECARFGTTGSFLVNTTTNGGWGTDAKIEAQASTGCGVSGYATGAGGASLRSRGDTDTTDLIAFYRSTVKSGSFISSGGGTPNIQWLANNQAYVIAGGSGGVTLASAATAWAAISDETLKTDLALIQSGAEKVASLRAVTGRYKTDAESMSRSFLIAQDVQKVLPEAVSTDADGTLSLRYTEVVPLLVAAIQELTTRLAALESK
jgi:hypothetical protein